MHNAALTPEQVAALYASGSAHGAPLPPEQPDPGPPPPPPPPSTYPSAVTADAPSLYWRLNELSQTTVADASGHNRTGTYRNGLSYGVLGALTDNSTAVLSPGTSGVAYSNQQQAAPHDLLARGRGSRRARTTAGRSSATRTPRPAGATSYDRQLYMTNDGRIAYGILSGGAQQTVTSTSVLQRRPVAPRRRDAGRGRHEPLRRRWPGRHQPDGDARRRTTATGASAAATSPAGRTHRRRARSIGTFDEVAVYPTELSAARVAAHHDAERRRPRTRRRTSTARASTPTSVDLAWDAPAGAVTGYKVYRDGVARRLAVVRDASRTRASAAARRTATR